MNVKHCHLKWDELFMFTFCILIQYYGGGAAALQYSGGAVQLYYKQKNVDEVQLLRDVTSGVHSLPDLEYFPIT